MGWVVETMTLSSPAKFVRAITDHDIDPVAFCTHLIHTGTKNEGIVRPEQTSAEFNIPPEAAEYLHEQASEFEIVEYQHPTDDSVIVNQSEARNFLIFLDQFDNFLTTKELELLADESIHDARLIASVPSGFEGHQSELMSRLIQFIRNANKELVVVTPFFTRFGVETFVDHLAQATSRGVQVTILTRDITSDGNNADQIEEISSQVNKSGKSENLEILEYASERGNLHAKALIGDGARAYVGSANFTNFSLKSAIEIGIIIQGEVVEELEDFFASIMASKDTNRVEDFQSS